MNLDEIFAAKLQDVDDQELLSLHFRCHQLWSQGDAKLKRKVERAHRLISAEMRRRKMKHASPLKEVKGRHRGLYLVPPHGRLIWEGKKKAVVKAKKFDMRGPLVIVSKENGTGLAFGLAEFDEPVEIDLSEFARQADKHRVTEEERKEWWPGHDKLYLYNLRRWTPFGRPAEVAVPQGVQTFMDEVVLKMTGSHLLDLSDLPEFVWVPDFLSVTGSLVYLKEGDRLPHDVDVVLRATADEKSGRFHLEVDDSFALKLQRALRERLGIEDLDIDWHPTAFGPNWPYVSVYDLVLRPKRTAIVQDIEEPEFESLRKEVTVAKEWFYPPKPARATGERPQTVENVLAALKDVPLPVWISVKRDGAHLVISRRGGKVEAWTEDGTKLAVGGDKGLDFDWPAGDWLVDGELEHWEGGAHFPREASVGLMHTGDLRGKFSLVVYGWFGPGGKLLPMPEVVSALESWGPPVLDKQTPKNGELYVLKHFKCSTQADLAKWAKALPGYPGSEGFVVQSEDNKTWLKYHKAIVATVQVIEEKPTKGPAHVYTFGVMHEGKVSRVGNSFGTALKLKPGDTFKVEAETVNLYDDAGSKRVTFWKPRVLEATTDKADSLDAVVKRAREAGILTVRKDGEFTLVEKVGTSASGHWAHAGIPGHRGGSAPGGGHAALGIKPGMSVDEVNARIQARRFRHQAPSEELMRNGRLIKQADADYEAGINPSYVAFLEGDGRVLVKGQYRQGSAAGSDPRMERSAYELAEAMGYTGLVPRTVVRSETESVHHWIEDTEVALEFGGELKDSAKEDLIRIRVLDLMTGNKDRHLGNIIFSKDGKHAYAIDNGYPRRLRGKQRDKYWPTTFKRYGLRGLTSEDLAPARRVLADKKLRDRLVAEGVITLKEWRAMERRIALAPEDLIR